MAAANAHPPEPPIRIPSVLLTRRAVRKLSSSLIAITSSYRSGCQAAGKKSSPTPSTRYGRPEPPENTEPSGSAAITRTAGLLSFRNRAVPVIDPHVPAPATKWVIRPAVCSQISGPVVLVWPSGLLGL